MKDKRKNRTMAVTFLSFLVFSLSFSLKSKAGESIDIGDTAPSFAIKSLDGRLYFLRDYCGEKLRKPWINKNKKCVVLSFFASWCLPCLEEIKLLHEIKAQFSDDDAVFLLINAGESPGLVQQVVEKQKIAITVLLDEYLTVANNYGIVDDQRRVTLPRMFIVDKDGIVTFTSCGFKNPAEFRNSVLEELHRQIQLKPTTRQ